jgi:hypothetical protein
MLTKEELDRVACSCPPGVVPIAGHQDRIRWRARRIVEALEQEGGSMSIADLRVRLGNRIAEALGALLDLGLIEHTGKSGTMSAGYALGQKLRAECVGVQP